MLYQGRWYYDVGDYVEFYAANTEEAKKIFLIRTLVEKKFFRGNSTRERKGFWNDHEFEKNTYPYKEEHPRMPEVVVKAMNGEASRENYNLNKQIEQLACTLTTALWNTLRQSDSNLYTRRYKGKYMNNYCMTLYNSDRNTMLLPMIFFDLDNKAHVSYYVLKQSTAGNSLYHWKKFPDKVINRPGGEEALEVIYDIRNFITNWGWGTVNMIGNNNFWNNNFNEEHLEVSIYNPTLLR
jgi:hypothetical protein